MSDLAATNCQNRGNGCDGGFGFGYHLAADPPLLLRMRQRIRFRIRRKQQRMLLWMIVDKINR